MPSDTFQLKEAAMPTDTPTTFSGKEMLGFHRYRLAEQVEEWVTEAVATPVGCEEAL